MYVKGVEGVKYHTMYKRSKAMLKVSKVVCVTFMQQYIQSNGTHVRGVKSVLYSVYRAPCTPGGKAYCSHQSCGLSGSPV